MQENLKEIPNFPKYRISNDGRKIYSTYKERYLSPYFDSNSGYWKIRLVNDNGRVIPAKVHRLVALAWHDNPNNFKCVCHKDDDKSNNCYSNLYWGTPKQNVNDRVKNGRQGNAKLVPQDIAVINKLYKGDKLAQLQIAKKYNVEQSTISRIVNGKRWGCVQ